jgi:hypothetical protein
LAISDTGAEVIDTNIKAGSTTKKANRARIRPACSSKKPELREKAPRRIMPKNGIVRERISPISLSHKKKKGQKALS